jgi:mannose-1-phosphate guanylyltransferase
MLIPVIIAGGSGTRLWPLSRQTYPKQFLNLFGEKSMLQETLLRLFDLNRSPAIVVCNAEHRFLAAEQLQAIDETDSTIILESKGHNTAPAIAVAALQALKQDKDPLLLVLSADHVIVQQSAFQLAIEQAEKLAMDDKLVTFGIVPNQPKTGYGYIRKGEKIENGFKVEKFLEKPGQETANRLVQSGNYLWNSGMFLFKAKHYLQELERYHPTILTACKDALNQGKRDLDFFRLAPFSSSCESISIDYAVMEKTDNAVVVPLDAGWSDIGSWSSLWEINEKDENNNTIDGDVIQFETNNCLLLAQNRLVATAGVDNIVVIETKDAVLVAGKDQTMTVKKIVEKLRVSNRLEEQNHRVIYRPWGHFDSVEEGEGFKVKRITVNPGAMLSLQKHRHRAEHWIVVSGQAKVTKGNKTFLVNKNKSVYIDIGETHALENPTKKPLEIIEVQTGDYLGEDDIIRFKDKYGRI